MDKVVVFVHPWMWAASMFEDLKFRSLGIVSIVTEAESTRIDPVWLKVNSDYVFFCAGDLADVDAVSTYLAENELAAVAVINGLDSTLVFADALQNRLLDLEIDLEASAVRLNKCAVNASLCSAGVPSVPSLSVTRLEDVVGLEAEIASLGKPFIAKPAADTAGMAGVELLQTTLDLNDYIERRLCQPNGYYPDRVVRQVIVQKYMAPSRYREFTIDFFSANGTHECIGISENRKDSAGVFRATVTYDTISNPEFSIVLQYVRRCLDVLNVRWGFSHNEVFWDMADNVFLVETNNRYAGQPVTDLYRLSYSRGALDPLLSAHAAHAAERSQRVELRAGYGAAIYLYNTTVDNPDVLDLGALTPQSRVMDFRGKGRPAIQPSFADNYDRAKHIGAIVIVQGDSSAQIEHAVDYLIRRDLDGKTFRV